MRTSSTTIVLAACGLLFVIVGRAPIAAAQDAPYPASSVIAGVEWQFDSHVQFGAGSDQWPLTWGSDGSLYGAWGDGWGWAKDDRKFSIGLTRIDGLPPQLAGTDLWGDGPGSGFAKPEALLAVGDTLNLFWTKGDSKSDTDNTHAAVSTDRGQTWKLSAKPLLPAAPAGFRVRGICQFGPGYTGAIDDYVYLYFGMNRASDLDLARAPREAVDEAGRYEWFAGLNDERPTWTRSLADKRPAFHDGAGYIWHIGVSYHSGLRRFLLTKPHYCQGDDRQTQFASRSGVSSLGIFDAPAPWGPWSTVYYQDRFMDDLVKFSYYLPPKFFNSEEGTLWLAWSGYPEYDNVNFVRGILRLKNGSTRPAAATR